MNNDIMPSLDAIRRFHEGGDCEEFYTPRPDLSANCKHEINGIEWVNGSPVLKGNGRCLKCGKVIY